MILNFPYLHKDELLYSGIARYMIIMNETRYKWIIEQIFNSRSNRASIEFPTFLQNLYNNLPPGNPYTPEYIINNHTIYPLFRPFINVERHKVTLQDMKKGDGKGIMTRLGVVASKVHRKNKFYYCPSCVKEQMDGTTEYFDEFWSRVYQSPGVYVCSKHKEWLKETDFIFDELNPHRYISIGELLSQEKIDLNSNSLDINNRTHKHLVEVTESVEWILNQQFSPQDINYYRLRYLEYLKNIGIAKLNGRVNAFKLKSSFLDYYPIELLKILNSDFDIDTEQSWVQMIVQKNRKAFHPVRHILMMIFLAGSVSKFFLDDYKFKPFGQGPWSCKNSICNKVINDIDLGYSYDNKEIFGELKCKCGYEYRLYKNGKVVVLRFGERWEKELVRLIQEGTGIYQVAAILDADVGTVKKYAQRNNVLMKWSAPRQIKNNDTTNDCEIKINHYDIWLQTIEEYPGLSKTEIRELIPASYAWLYRVDRRFLEGNSPTQSSPRERIKDDVDWEQRDKCLLELVQEIAEKWDVDCHKPRRLTKTAISEKTNKLSWLEKRPEKFPETLKYIKTIEEDVSEFQKRRVKWILENNYYNRQVKQWEIFRVAGLEVTRISKEVEFFISTEVKEHNKKVSEISYNGNEFYPLRED